MFKGLKVIFLAYFTSDTQVLGGHMKAMDVLFHLVYVSLISFKGLQSDRPKYLASLVDPSQTPKYNHKIPISWTMVLIFISAGSPVCPLSNEV